MTAPREVFHDSILASATTLVVAHNHPSGDQAPSAADVQMPRVLREAAKVIDIELMDHGIVGAAKADPTLSVTIPSGGRCLVMPFCRTIHDTARVDRALTTTYFGQRFCPKEQPPRW